MADPTFDPSEHTVQEVENYLADNPDDAGRVEALEASGKNRLGVQQAVQTAKDAPVLPEGAEVVKTAPSGQWERLEGPDGEPVTVDGNHVRVK